mmetsp:Transcript_3588/g.10109  ORF Transcript_3588/g.10109 Transcript_3588/m.10109 type:complete len:142 (+) Transcript_3588:1233-1658(+)
MRRHCQWCFFLFVSLWLWLSLSLSLCVSLSLSLSPDSSRTRRARGTSPVLLRMHVAAPNRASVRSSRVVAVDVDMNMDVDIPWRRSATTFSYSTAADEYLSKRWRHRALDNLHVAVDVAVAVDVDLAEDDSLFAPSLAAFW